MKKVKNVIAILLVMALTIVIGGCQDKKDGQKESQTDNSSQEATGEPVMGGSIVVGIPQDLEDSLLPTQIGSGRNKRSPIQYLRRLG